MTRIIEYDAVYKTLVGHDGLKSLYYNSGSFGFPDVTTRTFGWIGLPDATIRPEAVAFTRQIPAPFAENLCRRALEIWRDSVPGALWAMPRSHWAYELDFGSRDWMPDALREIGIDPAVLAPLTTGAAIEFELGHADEFRSFLAHLLDNLSGSSDFQLAWPGRPLLCTVHHHQQLWWTTTDEAVFDNILRAAE